MNLDLVYINLIYFLFLDDHKIYSMEVSELNEAKKEAKKPKFEIPSDLKTVIYVLFLFIYLENRCD